MVGGDRSCESELPAFSWDGQALASGSQDKTSKVLVNLKVLKTMLGSQCDVN
jgi:hypothetical protein